MNCKNSMSEGTAAAAAAAAAAAPPRRSDAPKTTKPLEGGRKQKRDARMNKGTRQDSRRRGRPPRTWRARRGARGRGAQTRTGGERRPRAPRAPDAERRRGGRARGRRSPGRGCRRRRRRRHSGHRLGVSGCVNPPEGGKSAYINSKSRGQKKAITEKRAGRGRTKNRTQTLGHGGVVVVPGRRGTLRVSRAGHAREVMP